jgi:hypothetical protein
MSTTVKSLYTLKSQHLGIRCPGDSALTHFLWSWMAYPLNEITLDIVYKYKVGWMTLVERRTEYERVGKTKGAGAGARSSQIYTRRIGDRGDGQQEKA